MENQEPIRIAHIIGKWLGGGVESVVTNYYRHIDRTKIQFDFICDKDSTNIPYDEIEQLGGRVILVPPYQKVFEYQKELIKIFKDNNYKIVHSHINTLSVFPLRAAKKAGVPIRIAHSHSTTNKKEWKKNLVKQILRPFSKVYATDYMCCSELAGRWLFGNKEYDKGNVYLLNNAIDLDKFKYDEQLRNKKRKELNIKDDTLVIGHVGRFVEQKNHRFLIDVFNEVHKQKENSILLLAGQGPLMEEMKEKVKKLNLDECVKFLGQRNDASELYQAFDVFLLPSLYEGLPVVGVEAQASGNLCIFSDDMTKETKVLDSTVFMSLKNSAKEWADCIIDNLKKYKKHDTKNEVSRYGFNIKIEASKLEKYYINKYKRIKIFIGDSNDAYPVPAVNGGAVQSLVEKYVILADEKNINLEITSFYTKEAYNESKKYENVTFKWIKVPLIIKIMDSMLYNIMKVIKKSSSVSYRKLFSLLYYIFKSSKELKRNYYYKVILENNVPLIYIIKLSKYKGDYYYHFHNIPRINVHCNKYFDNCKSILCVSEFVKNKILSGKTGIGTITKSNVTVAYNKIDTSLFSPCSSNETDILRAKLKLTKDDYVIIFVGRLLPEKGIGVLLDAIEQITDVKLLIVGSAVHNAKTSSTFESQLFEKTKNMKDRIVFTGYVDQKELYKYYNLANLAVLPSVWDEPAGLTMVEAISCGTPLITTNAGGIPEYVSKYSIILNNDNNLLNNLVSAIEKEKKTNNDLLNKDIRKIHDEFSYKNYLDELLEIIDY